MDDRVPNLMECDECGKVGDFKDQYKPDTLFHLCDGKHVDKMGIWRRYKNSEVKDV